MKKHPAVLSLTGRIGRFGAVLACLGLVLTGPVPLHAYTDDSDVTDGAFFGVWNGSTWTTPAMLNYSYSANLNPVKTAVQAGNYAAAKSALLTYYKNRTSPVDLPYTGSGRDANFAPIAKDWVFVQSSERYVSTITLNGTADQNFSVNITAQVNAALASSTKQLAFMLMARDRLNADAGSFNSSEAGSGKPTLTLTGGSPSSVVAGEDIFIRNDGSGPYGTGTDIQVKESGSPIDTFARRGYIKFDLTSVTGTVTNATLNLTGRNQSAASKAIMIFTTNDLGWTESSKWLDFQGHTYSYTGVAGGYNWIRPTGANSGWLQIQKRFTNFDSLIEEYVATGDNSYAARLLDYTTDYIKDAEALGDAKDYGGDKLDASITAACWTRQFHTLRNSTAIDGNATSAILKTIRKWADWCYTGGGFTGGNGNWEIIQSKVLYQVAMYFPELTGSGNWKTTAISRLETLAVNACLADGSYWEAATGYTAVGAGSLLGATDYATLYGESLSATFDEKVYGLGRYMMNLCMPNGFHPGVGDGGISSYSFDLEHFATYYNDLNMLFVSSNGVAGTAPSHRSTIYPYQQMANLRTGWLPNDLYLNFQTNTGNHENYDQLSVIAYAYGRRLIVDPGIRDYSVDAITTWQKSTEAHNTIEIDNVNQDTVNNSYLHSASRWSTNDHFDFVSGWASCSPVPHTRTVLFIKPSYWIVSDLLTPASGTHSYKQTWHYEPLANPSLNATTKTTTTSYTGGGANIKVVPADPGSFSSASIDSGWYSQNFYQIAPASYTSYAKNSVSGNVTFDTVLYPMASGSTPDVRVTRLTTSPSVASSVATALKVDLNFGVGNKGYYYLSHDAAPTTARGFDIYNFNGRAAYVETNNAGTRVSALVKQGKVLTESGSNLISSTYSIDNLGVVWNGSTLELYSSDLTPSTDTAKGIAILAPGITTVKLNGTTISSATVGNYKYAVSAMYPKIQAEAYSSMSGVQKQLAQDGPPVDSGEAVAYIQSGDYVIYNGVNFGTGVGGIQVRVSAPAAGSSIEVRLGSATGTLLGTITVPNTGGWQTWTTASLASTLGGTTGTQNLCLKFTGGAGYLMNLNWFKFTP